MKILKVKCLAPTRLDNYLMQQYPGTEPGPPEQGPAGEQDQAERQKAAAFHPRDGR